MGKVHNLKEYRGLRKKLRKDMTEAEHKLWMYLRGNQTGYKFRRQASIGKYIVDFYCPIKKLVIELDGSQHMENEEYDKMRTKYLNSLKIKIVRFWNNDVLENIEGVMEKIIYLIGPPSNDSF